MFKLFVKLSKPTTMSNSINSIIQNRIIPCLSTGYSATNFKVLLNSSADYTLAAGFQTLITDERTINQPAFTAGALLTAIPIVILFIVLQKQLVSGLSNGATKG